MNFLVENKGLIIFYLCMTIFTMCWVSKVENDNDLMLKQKSYVITDNN